MKKSNLYPIICMLISILGLNLACTSNQLNINSEKTEKTHASLVAERFDYEQFHFIEVASGYHGAYCYPSTKVELVIQQGIQTGEPPSDSMLHSLNTKEKFIYTFCYPESYLQTCSLMRYEDSIKATLFWQIPFSSTGKKISQRQLKLLLEHRDSSIYYLNDCIRKSTFVPINGKQLIIHLGAFESIPLLVEKIKNPKTFDTFLLSVLIQLMLKFEAPEFELLSDKIYHELKTRGSYYQMNCPLKDYPEQICIAAQSFYNIQSKKKNPISTSMKERFINGGMLMQNRFKHQKMVNEQNDKRKTNYTRE